MARSWGRSWPEVGRGRGIERPKRLHDRLRRLRPRDSQGVGFHRGQSSRVVQQVVDLVGQHGQVVAADRRAFFEEVVAVAFLLARDRVDDDVDESSRQRLGGGQAARLADDQVGGGHQLVHLSRESEDVESDRRAVARRPESLLHLGLQLGVLAADRDDLRGVPQPGHRVEQFADPADAEASGRDQDGGRLRIQSVLDPHRDLVGGLRERRVDGDSRDGDPFGGDSEFFEVGAGLVDGDEVVLALTAEPHGVDVEIGHHGRLTAGELRLGPQPRDDLGGQEVGADGDVGLIFAEQFRERPRVQLLERELRRPLLPRAVELVVEPSQDLGHGVHHVEVGPGIHATEQRIGEFQRVDVPDLADRPGVRERLLQRLGRADVPGTCGGGKDEDFLQHGGIPAFQSQE